MLLALEEAHSQEVVHANIASDHIFVKPLDAEHPEGPRCVVLANFKHPSLPQKSDPYYYSPENAKLLRAGKPMRPSKKADIYSLGVTLLEMCNLTRYGQHKRTALCELTKENGKEPFYNEMVDHAKSRYPSLSHLIDALLIADEEQRLPCSDILLFPDVKWKAHKIITSELFKKEMFDRVKRKLEIGWARQSDKELYEKLWKETKEKQEQEFR